MTFVTQAEQDLGAYQATIAIETSNARECRQITLRAANQVDAVARCTTFCAAQDWRLLQIGSWVPADVPSEGRMVATSQPTPAAWRPSSNLKPLVAVSWPDFVPLDDQFGAHPVVQVPLDLADILFDAQPVDDTGEHDTPDLPVLETFVIIDAAATPDLPDRVRGAGLAMQPLFPELEATALAEVGPYLVRLEKDNTLTRMFFTADAPGSLWDRRAAVFLRSRLGLHALAAQIQPFTQLEDAATDKMHFFRIYAPSVMLTTFPHMPLSAQDKLTAGIDLIMLPTNNGGLTGWVRMESALADLVPKVLA